MQQTPRQILWVVDVDGDSGKTFLAQFFHVLYKFLLLDGTMKMTDVGILFKKSYKGVCMDIPRASVDFFNYEVAEAFKNGYLSTGKYSGKTVMFPSLPVIVFSNSYPDYTRLSRDRWQVLTLGEGVLSNVGKTSILSPVPEFPFVNPPQPPDLSENINLRDLICQKMMEYCETDHASENVS